MKISIITASYNSGKTIRHTVESVLRQTYPDFEYIVVDGGSTDNSIDIVKEYQVAFKGRLKWISEKDKGIYDAMNKGIRMATGDVVGILNSDDFYTDENVLQTVADSRLFSPFWLRFGFMPAHPSFYCKREVFDKAGLYSLDYKIGADYEMMVRLFRKYGISSRYISKDFVTMRTGGASNHHFSNRLTLIREDVKACRDNGIYTNSFLVSLKFLYKIFEFRVF